VWAVHLYSHVFHTPSGLGRAPRFGYTAINRRRFFMPATITETQVKDALRTVIDPELHHNVVELGFIQEIEIVGDYVHLDIQLTTPYCPFASQIVDQMRAAVAGVPGVKKVEIERACMKED
jgi:metal-sulfur cluster biosynthetic enzyme